jgi:hypothetical protein
MVGCTPWEDGWIGETLSEEEVKAEEAKEVSYFVQVLVYNWNRKFGA